MSGSRETFGVARPVAVLSDVAVSVRAMTDVVFYALPAQYLQPGLSTDDAQDILEVSADGGFVSVVVYTPRPDDPELDSYNRSAPESRIYDRNRLVGLAVYGDTRIDLSRHAEAQDLVLR